MPDACETCNEVSCIGCQDWDNDVSVDNYDDILTKYYDMDEDVNADALRDAQLAAGMI